MNKPFLTLLLAGISSALIAGVPGKVNADFLNMRTGAGLEHPVAGKLPLGTTVNILREVGNWLEISAPAELKLYISEARVNPDGTLNGELNLRSGMSVAAPVLGVLPKGAKVRRLEERRNGWVRIEPPESVKVYVSSFCVDYDKAAFAPAKPEVKPEAKPEAKTEVKPEARPEVKPEAKTDDKVELTGTLTAWKYSVTPETAYALLDGPKGRCLGFIPAQAPTWSGKAADFAGKTVRLTGRIVGRTPGGAPLIRPETVTEAAAK